MSMSHPDPAFWSEKLRQTLVCYEEPLLREVAGRLVKPRNQWPLEDLIERSLATVDNPAVLDRRLQELEPASRQVLALMGHSRQSCWSLANLIELVLSLGHPDGLQPIFALLQAGLLYPILGSRPEAAPQGTLKTFEQWLAFSGPPGPKLFTLPLIATRAVGEELGLPDLSEELANGELARTKEDKSERSPSISFSPFSSPSHQEADGLEWLLRLAVLWQQVASAPLRRTQQGGFFKRDLERLSQDPLLNAPPADRLAGVRDLGFFLVSLAELEGIVREADGELRAGSLPAAWETSLSAALESLWTDLPRLSGWNPLDGWRDGEPAGNPFPSAYLLLFLLLARLPENAWIRPFVLETWLLEHHPYWKDESLRPSRQQPWVEAFLLGIAYQLRLLHATRDSQGEWRVRLSPTGRWLLRLGEIHPAEANYPQTLLVQPNLEIIAYRQGLTSSLIVRLTRFAAWKSLGAACTLQLEPETVYRALESGQTYETIRLTLEQHGTRVIPPAVLDSLRTWSNKRDRITVYPSATLLEFASAADLNEALARGLPAQRLADTLAVVVSEDSIDFRHFRLTGTRDYSLPPDRCVSVEDDGVTLTVDQSRSDLLLETELPRFAEPLERSASDGRRQYRLTPASLASARESGLSASTLETWFQQRAGQMLPASARLLLSGSQSEPPRLRRHLVLHVADESLADGLQQWPETRSLIEDRLGPTTLVVGEEQVKLLRERLQAAGITIREGE
jgi:hypothetical protein